MRLIVGLGNPGPEYAATRHNVGFLVLDELARRHGLAFRRAKWRSLSAQGTGLVLLKPQTYMNDSGGAVGPAASFYKVDPGDVLVVHDDMDLPLGRLRFREGGSAGGHNGVRSIIQHLKTDQFSRLKLGVGRPAGPGATDHVLGEFRKHERSIVDEMISRGADAVEAYLANGFTAAANRFNGGLPV